MKHSLFVAILMLAPLTALHAAEPLPTPAALRKEYDPNRGDFNEEIVKQETRDGLINRRAEANTGCKALARATRSSVHRRLRSRFAFSSAFSPRNDDDIHSSRFALCALTRKTSVPAAKQSSSDPRQTVIA